MRRVPRRLARCAGTAGGCALAALLAAGCASSGGGSATPASSPAASASALAARLGVSPARLAALSRAYLGIAVPANHQLDVDNDGYADAEHDNLARARAFLLAEVAEERRFDSELARLTFPPLVERPVQALIRANDQRITLTGRQAGAATLSALRAFDSQHKGSDAAVEQPVRQIRALLGLPPPATS